MLVKQNICKSELFPAPIFFIMNEFVNFTVFYNFGFHLKNDIRKQFPLRAFFTPTSKNSFRRNTFGACIEIWDKTQHTGLCKN